MSDVKNMAVLNDPDDFNPRVAIKLVTVPYALKEAAETERNKCAHLKCLRLF
jgi:hypothetical protein